MSLSVSKLVFWTALFVSTPMPASASLTCLTGSDPAVPMDASQLDAARLAVDGACPCARFDGSTGNTKGDYGKCVATATAALAPGSLRKQCIGTLKGYYKNSTCGTDPNTHAQPCIKRVTSSGKLSCSIKATTAKDGVTPVTACRAGGAFTVTSCQGFAHCIDAADIDGDHLLSASDGGGCSSSAPRHIPAGYPVAALPPDGAPVPPAPPLSSNYCDYYYCYTYTAGTWSAESRAVTPPPAPPVLPPNTTLPPPPETPYYPSDYCDRSYCYKASLSDSWTASLRYGSELTAPQTVTSTSFCGLNYCYNQSSLVWSSLPIDAEAIGMPSAPFVEDAKPAPENLPLPSSSVPSFCDSNWCYQKNNYGMWYPNPL